MLEKHDELKMSLLSELYKIRKQILHLMDEYSFSGAFLRWSLDSISVTKHTEEVLHLPQVSHCCSSAVQLGK